MTIALRGERMLDKHLGALSVNGLVPVLLGEVVGLKVCKYLPAATF